MNGQAMVWVPKREMSRLRSLSPGGLGRMVLVRSPARRRDCACGQGRHLLFFRLSKIMADHPCKIEMRLLFCKDDPQVCTITDPDIGTVVYFGAHRYPLDERIEAVPAEALLRQESEPLRFPT